MCRRFAAEGARVVVIDRDAASAEAVAAEIEGTALVVDVSHGPALAAALGRAEATLGAIDLLASNAGVLAGGDASAPDDLWQLAWDVHVMAHVVAARAVLPRMLARGAGTLLATASAAGLLTNLGAAPYAVTKHATVAFYEWLAVTYGDRGIRFHCLCPMGVNTAMLAHDHPAIDSVKAAGAVLDPDAVADAVMRGLADGRFLILPHPEVGEFLRKKAADPDGWIHAMQRFRARLEPKK
jgi:NAD(P)-dependent dehydrogenase (short-subunit alcohol dehydrogenase family)